VCAGRLCCFGASQANAGRDIVIDAYPEGVSLCTFSDGGCSPLSSVLGDVYVYSNGAISLGGTVSGLGGGGTWFAPGALGDGSYEALAVHTNLLGLGGYFDGLAINFYAAGTDVVWPNIDGDPGTTPLMQIQIGDWDQPLDEFGDYNHLGTQVAFAYTGSPAAGATIAYNVTSGDAPNCYYDDGDNYVCDPTKTWGQTVTSNGALNLGGSDFVFNFASNSSTDLDPSSIFNAQFDAVASPSPEPATWASMLLGFGVIGGARRRRTSANVIA